MQNLYAFSQKKSLALVLMRKFRRPSKKLLSVIDLIVSKLSIEPKKAQAVFVAEGLREIGSGLGVTSILLFIVDKKAIISEAGLCFFIFLFMWYTSLVLINQH